MYFGRFLTSRYIFSKYNPRMPKLVSKRPPSNNNIHIKDGQPATGSPIIKARINTTIKTTILINDNTNPITEIARNGHVEKAIIPSKE